MALFRWLVIARPLVALSVLGAVLFFSAFGLGSFHLDASSDSLVLESDTDLELYREVTQRYGSSEFLLLVYTPEGDLFSRPILAEIRHLREELRALPGVIHQASSSSGTSSQNCRMRSSDAGMRAGLSVPL